MASDKEAPEHARGVKGTIFVSDPSAEAEQVAASLRAQGYVIVDVPLAMLVARVAVQRPRIVIVDADADGAYAAVFRMRELPDVESIDVLFLGRSNEPTAEAIEDAGSFFARPVDVQALLRRIETLTSEDVPARPSVPVAPPQRASARPSAAALPPPSMRSRSSVLPPPPPSRARMSQPPPSAAILSKRPVGSALSNELLELLAEAEERAQAHAALDSNPPSPEDEIEAVLPTELLAALDEPLEEPELDDEEVERGRHTTSSGGRKITTGASARSDIEVETGREITSEAALLDKTQPPTVPPPRSRESSRASKVAAKERDSSPPPATTASPASMFSRTLTNEALAHVLGVSTPAPAQDLDEPGGSERTSDAASLTSPGAGVTSPAGRFSLAPNTLAMRPNAASLGPASLGPASTPSPSSSGAASSRGPSTAPRVGAEAVLGPGDALDTVARAIATRVTGSLSFEAEGGLRRVVVREGDLVTCASSLETESLLAYLESRGDLPKDRAEGLAGRVPAFGRHAGAALVAHGVLRQDQLWPVLRSHAEWVLGRTLGITHGVFVREGEAPGRLKGEPSVFGGSTGAEVLVEVARRVIPAAEAIARLGGPDATFASGANDALLVECALDERDTQLVRGALGRHLEDVIASSGQETAPLLYALTVIGILDCVRALPRARTAPAYAPPDALDEEAIAAKVEARLALVDEGDYFAVLGVPHSATGYEIRRAFLDLRRTFEPARLLTPNLAHLAGDVGKITTVLEEAFEILRDDVRRERYRRAIEAQPVEG
jgi:hypothetical protein